MFRYHESITKEAVDGSIDILVDDDPVAAREGQILATVLLVNGLLPIRTSPVTGAPRAPYCMMGTCFECLVEIDGESNHQACMTTVRRGMKVRRQIAES